MTHVNLSARTLFLTVLLCAGIAAVFIALPFSERAFAASRTNRAAILCSQQPDSAHCSNRDPMQQGCATPTTTTVSRDILAPGGTVIGRVDRRFSQVCHSWWGRVFDYRHLPGASILIQVDATHYTLPFNVVAYSDMVFDTSRTPAPLVTGTLTTNGKPDFVLSATLPAVPIPVMP